MADGCWMTLAGGPCPGASCRPCEPETSHQVIKEAVERTAGDQGTGSHPGFLLSPPDQLNATIVPARNAANLIVWLLRSVRPPYGNLPDPQSGESHTAHSAALTDGSVPRSPGPEATAPGSSVGQNRSTPRRLPFLGALPLIVAGNDWSSTIRCLAMCTVRPRSAAACSNSSTWRVDRAKRETSAATSTSPASAVSSSRPSNSLGTFISTPTGNCASYGTRTLGLRKSSCSRSEALSVHSCSIATQTPIWGLRFLQQPRPAVVAYVRRGQLNCRDGLQGEG